MNAPMDSKLWKVQSVNHESLSGDESVKMEGIGNVSKMEDCAVISVPDGANYVKGSTGCVSETNDTSTTQIRVARAPF